MRNVKGSSYKGLFSLALTGLCLVGLQMGALAQSVKKSARAGTGVYEIAVNETDGFLYVSGIGTRKDPKGGIMKIDPKTLEIVDSIMLPDVQPFGLAVNSKTQIAYTSNTVGNGVSAVDLKTKKILANINSGAEKSHTRELIIDEDKNLIYVSNVADNSNIWVIDGKTNTFLYEITDLGKTVTGMAFSPSKDKIYITILGENKIGVVDIASRKMETTFESGGEGSINIVTDAIGERLFVTNRKTHSLTVLSNDGALLKIIPTGEGAIGIAYDAAKDRIIVANRDAGTTTFIDGKSYEVVKDLQTGTHPNNVKVTKNGTIFVLNKAKSGKRGDTTPPPPDENGDTITMIN